MNPIYITIHGYNVSDGGASGIDKLGTKLALKGLDVRMGMADYGWSGLLATRFGGINIAAANLSEELEEDREYVLIGHSSGVAVALATAKLNDNVIGIVALNGALNEDAEFPDTLEFVHNYYSKGDWVLRWGAWLRPAHVWGRFGYSGYKGKSSMVEDFPLIEKPGHSDVFKEPLLTKYSENIHTRVSETALSRD